MNPVIVLALVAVISPLIAGIILFDGLRQLRRRKDLYDAKDQTGTSSSTRSAHQKQSTGNATELKQKQEALDKREKALLSKESSLTTREEAVKTKEEALNTKEAELSSREAVISEKEKSLTGKEADEPSLVQEEQGKEEEKTDGEAQADDTSEKEKRLKMIETELADLIKEVEDNELEDDMEEESKEALGVAALNVCYRKKFYDCMADKLVIFPSVAQTLVDSTLIEEAEKHYFDEDDEFPLQYSAGLRAIATEKLVDNDDDIEYMEMLAVDVEI